MSINFHNSLHHVLILLFSLSSIISHELTNVEMKAQTLAWKGCAHSPTAFALAFQLGRRSNTRVNARTNTTFTAFGCQYEQRFFDKSGVCNGVADCAHGEDEQCVQLVDTSDGQPDVINDWGSPPNNSAEFSGIVTIKWVDTCVTPVCFRTREHNRTISDDSLVRLAHLTCRQLGASIATDYHGVDVGDVGRQWHGTVVAPWAWNCQGGENTPQQCLPADIAHVIGVDTCQELLHVTCSSSCIQNVVSRQGVITTTGFPSVLLPNTQCHWHIRADNETVTPKLNDSSAIAYHITISVLNVFNTRINLAHVGNRGGGERTSNEASKLHKSWMSFFGRTSPSHSPSASVTDDSSNGGGSEYTLTGEFERCPYDYVMLSLGAYRLKPTTEYMTEEALGLDVRRLCSRRRIHQIFYSTEPEFHVFIRTGAHLGPLYGMAGVQIQYFAVPANQSVNYYYEIDPPSAWPWYYRTAVVFTVLAIVVLLLIYLFVRHRSRLSTQRKEHIRRTIFGPDADPAVEDFHIPGYMKKSYWFKRTWMPRKRNHVAVHPLYVVFGTVPSICRRNPNASANELKEYASFCRRRDEFNDAYDNPLCHICIDDEGNPFRNTPTDACPHSMKNRERYGDHFYTEVIEGVSFDHLFPKEKSIADIVDDDEMRREAKRKQEFKDGVDSDWDQSGTSNNTTDRRRAIRLSVDDDTFADVTEVKKIRNPKKKVKFALEYDSRDYDETYDSDAVYTKLRKSDEFGQSSYTTISPDSTSLSLGPTGDKLPPLFSPPTPYYGVQRHSSTPMDVSTHSAPTFVFPHSDDSDNHF